MQTGSYLRCCWPCLGLVAALGHWCVQAADYEALQAPLRHEDPAHYHPPAHARLVFKAPPSQLFEPWRCARPVASANSWAVVPCSPYERPDPNPYSGYPSESLQYPFAPLRCLPQPYPLRPPQPHGETVPGAPPSQLPSDLTLPSGADILSPQLLR